MVNDSVNYHSKVNHQNQKHILKRCERRPATDGISPELFRRISHNIKLYRIHVCTTYICIPLVGELNEGKMMIRNSDIEDGELNKWSYFALSVGILQAFVLMH